MIIILKMKMIITGKSVIFHIYTMFSFGGGLGFG